MKRFLLALVVFVLAVDDVNGLLAQAREPAAVFGTALRQIERQTRIPIVLPAKLPRAIRGRDIKLVSGELLEDGYRISLFYSAIGDGASFAGSFSGSSRGWQKFSAPRDVKLSNGLDAVFFPVSCGGSCAPANL